jgi:outer membrane protein assembly factor BamB
MRISMRICYLVGVVVVTAALATLPLAAAEPLAFFRAGYGVADAAGKLPESVDSAADLVWKTPLPFGHSSPCVAGDSVYVTTFDDEKLFTVCLDRETGSIRWKQQAPNDRVEPYHPTGSPAAATCACDGERVYVFFGSYGLLCYDRGGKLVWSLPMKPFQDEFGAPSSPVLVDGKLLLNEDHDLDSFLLCVDAATGKEIWRARRDGFTRSYATPIVVDCGTLGGQADKKQVIVAGALQLCGYDLADGKQLWHVDGLARIVNTTPCVDGDLLYVSTWSPGGDSDARAAMEPWDVALQMWDKDNDQRLTREECNNKDVLDRFYRIDLDQNQFLDQAEWVKYARVFELARNSVMVLRMTGNGAAPTLVWQHDKNIPYVPSPLVYRGVLYLIKEGGILTSFDARDGRVLKMARARGTGTYFASPIAGDGKVYLISEKGVLTVLKADGEWEALAQHDFGERTVATPALADGRLYVRTEQALYCFGRR